jgi:4-amino-4-deoxy-L-arabinose transferase-like glycosyltransferase
MTRSEVHRPPLQTTAAAAVPITTRARALLSSRVGVVLLPTLVLVVAAFAFRSVGLTTSFELWVDEMLYAELGASVARGEMPNLPDGPFFLHPPGFFIVEAIAIHLFGITGDRMELVYQLRWVSAFCGALSVGLIFLILRRPIGAPAAFVAGLLAVFEPFVLRNNSRVFIETTGMLAVLIGLALVVDHLGRDADQRSRLRLVVAGLALGYGLLTKDVLFVCTVAPVVLAVLWRRTLPLRDGAVLVGTTLVPYVIYLIVLTSTGGMGGWFTAKSQGVLRMLGFVQATGFNAPNSPSLIGRILDQLGSFGTSYVLLLVCPFAGVVAALSASPARRFLGLVALMMGLFGVYSAAFGTFEEQYGYPVMIAGILAAAISAVELSVRFPRARRPITGFCLLFVVAAAVLGIRAEATTDDGFLQVRDWMRTNLPAGAKVGVTNSTGAWAFDQDPHFGVWASLPDLADNGASYVLTQSLPTSLGYGYAKPELVPWLAANATPMIAVNGPTNGVTTLWFIDEDALQAGAAARVAFPANEQEQ